MQSSAIDAVKMGLWTKLMSQPLRYLYSLASYVMPLQRVRNVSPHYQTTPKLNEVDRHPLDIILNEQKPFHPSVVFSNSTLGHLRSFSTSAVDKGRRFPGDRSKPSEAQNSSSDRPPGARDKNVFRGGNWRSRSPPRHIKPGQRGPVRRPPVKANTSSIDILDSSPEFVSPTTSTSSNWPQPTFSPAYVPAGIRSLVHSRSAPSFLKEEGSEEPSRARPLFPQSFSVRSKASLWDTWISRDAGQCHAPESPTLNLINRCTDHEHESGLVSLRPL